MPILRAQVVLKGKSGLPEDQVVNTWHFEAGAADAASKGLVRDHLVEFYNVVAPAVTGGPSAPLTLSAFMSDWLDRGANKSLVRVYDMGQPEPRLPTEFTWTLGPSTGATSDPELPAELSIVASFYAGVNRARTRGRVYLGPWQQRCNTDDGTTQRSRPLPDLVYSIAGSLQRLINKPASTVNLGVYSRGLYQVNKVAQPPVPPSIAIATDGWVDDAWDIQRRRGQKAVLRVAVT